MIYYRGASRQAAQVARSQLAVRLGLAVYTALCTAVVLRSAVLVLQFPETVWTVRLILATSAPIVLPFRIAPAANHHLLGNATLAEVTALLVLLAIPLLLIGRGRRASAR
jgi:hypothetical protein